MEWDVECPPKTLLISDEQQRMPGLPASRYLWAVIWTSYPRAFLMCHLAGAHCEPSAEREHLLTLSMCSHPFRSFSAS